MGCVFLAALAVMVMGFIIMDQDRVIQHCLEALDAAERTP
jgi:hypothetical protein